MPLLVECTSCGKKYNADESMAGRRIKCRQCGNIFVVPSLTGDDDLNESLSAMSDMSQAGESMMESSVVGATRSDESESEEPQAFGDGPRRRKRFNYPYAQVVDRWLPIVLCIGGPAWIVATAYHFDETHVPWMPITRSLIMLLAYLALMFPLGLAGIRMAGRDLHFSLPKDQRWRAMAAFMPAFAFGLVLWIVGGTIGTLILGLVVGYMVSVMVIWLLFHLQPPEIPAVGGYGGGMFAFGVALGGGILFGLNVLLSTMLVSMHKADRLPGSPIAAAFSWPKETVEKPTFAAKKPPAPPTTAPVAETPTNPQPAPASQPTAVAQGTDTNPAATQKSTDPFAINTNDAQHTNIFDGKPGEEQANATNVNPPPQSQITPGQHTPQQVAAAPVTDSPLVASIEVAPIESRFDELIRPATPSPWIALLRRDGTSPEIDLYYTGSAGAPNVKPWAIAGTSAYEQGTNRYVLSADGDLLGHITTFPSLSVPVYSFKQKSVTKVLQLVANNAQVEIVGFAGNDRLVVHRWLNNDDGFECWDARSGSRMRSFPTQHIERQGTTVALAPGGDMLALAARDTNRNAPLGAVYLHDLPNGSIPRKLSIPNLDPQWPITPAGMAFSPDGSKVAIFFEQNNNALLVVYRSRGAIKPLLVQPYAPLPMQPPRDFDGSALTWISEDALLLYGQSVMSLATGAEIGKLGIANVTSQHFVQPDMVQLGFAPHSGEHQVAMVKLKMDEIAKLAK